MATYTELKALDSNESLINRVEVALWVALNTIATEAAATPDHAARIAWAKSASTNTRSTAINTLALVLAANSSATTAQIVAATDASIQTAVNNTIKVLAGIAA